MNSSQTLKWQEIAEEKKREYWREEAQQIQMSRGRNGYFVQ
jgi:hypothetical protein